MAVFLCWRRPDQINYIHVILIFSTFWPSLVFGWTRMYYQWMENWTSVWTCGQIKKVKHHLGALTVWAICATTTNDGLYSALSHSSTMRCIVCAIQPCWSHHSMRGRWAWPTHPCDCRLGETAKRSDGGGGGTLVIWDLLRTDDPVTVATAPQPWWTGPRDVAAGKKRGGGVRWSVGAGEGNPASRSSLRDHGNNDSSFRLAERINSAGICAAARTNVCRENPSRASSGSHGNY